jgi:hypothetical protein
LNRALLSALAVIPGVTFAAAKAEPGEVNYGSGGNGSPQHIAMALDPPLFPDQTS